MCAILQKFCENLQKLHACSYLRPRVSHVPHVPTHLSDSPCRFPDADARAGVLLHLAEGHRLPAAVGARADDWPVAAGLLVPLVLLVLHHLQAALEAALTEVNFCRINSETQMHFFGIVV